MFFWVEGPDDQRFFQKIIQPLFERTYLVVHVRQYSNMKKVKRNQFITGIIGMGDDYVIVGDINSSPCVTGAKEILLEKFGFCDEEPRVINADRLMVIVREIESWYLAGLSDLQCSKFGVSILENTDSVTKGQFDRMIPHTFDSRVDFLMEILKVFSRDTAKQKNQSFGYFMTKHAIS